MGVVALLGPHLAGGRRNLHTADFVSPLPRRKLRIGHWRELAELEKCATSERFNLIPLLSGRCLCPSVCLSVSLFRAPVQWGHRQRSRARRA